MSHILEVLDLVDTPNTYSGVPGRPVRVNDGATALVFSDVAAAYSALDTSAFAGLLSATEDDVQAFADLFDDLTIADFPDEANYLLAAGTRELTGDWGLGDTYGITEVPYIMFNTSYADGNAEGKLNWNDDDGTLNLGMKGGNVNQQIGLELMVQCRNITGSQIDNGTVVKITGAAGNKPTIAPATTANPWDGYSVTGIATEDIVNNSNGYVTTIGVVRDLDTSSFSEGDALYLSNSSDGEFTDTYPTAPDIVTHVGVVTRSHATEGEIICQVVTVPPMTLLADTFGTPTASGEFYAWDTGDSRFELLDINDYVPRSEWLQNGVVDKDDIDIAWDDTTRTLTISPAVTSFDYYYEGIRYTETGSLSGTISDTEGLHLLYIASGGAASLTDLLNPNEAQVEAAILGECLIAYVYWDATNSDGRLLDERHGSSMSPETHHYLHETRGARYYDGMTPGDIITGGNGSSDTHAQFSITAGRFYDEDLQHDTLARTSTATWEAYYVDGSGNVRWTDCEATFPVVAIGGVIAYNNGGTLTAVGAQKYVLYHIFSTNIHTDSGGDYAPVVTPGIAEYNSLAAAQDAALTEIQQIDFGNWPVQEVIPIATVIYLRGAAMSNGVTAAIQATEGGGDFIDWRYTSVSGSSTSVNDHGALSGLLDDDHTLYLLASDATDRTTFATNWTDLTDGGNTTLHTHDNALHTDVNGEINGLVASSVSTADVFLYEQSATFIKRKVSFTNLVNYIDTRLGAITPTHSHDDQYYTESEVDTLLDGYLPLTAGAANTLTGTLYSNVSTHTTTLGGASLEILAQVTDDILKVSKGLNTATLEYYDDALAQETQLILYGPDTDVRPQYKDKDDNYYSLAFTTDTGAGTDTTAIHDNVASEISAVTNQATPNPEDFLLMEDSQDSNSKKRLTLKNVGYGLRGPIRTDKNIDNSYRSWLAAWTDHSNSSGAVVIRPWGANDPGYAVSVNIIFRCNYGNTSGVGDLEFHISGLWVNGTTDWDSGKCTVTTVGHGKPGVLSERVRFCQDASGYPAIVIGNITDTHSACGLSIDRISWNRSGASALGIDDITVTYDTALTSFTTDKDQRGPFQLIGPVRVDNNSNTYNRRFINVLNGYNNANPGGALVIKPYGNGLGTSQQCMFDFTLRGHEHASGRGHFEIRASGYYDGSNWHATNSGDAQLVSGQNPFSDKVRLMEDASGYPCIVFGETTDVHAHLNWYLDMEISYQGATGYLENNEPTFAYDTALTSFTTAQTFTDLTPAPTAPSTTDITYDSSGAMYYSLSTWQTAHEETSGGPYIIHQVHVATAATGNMRWRLTIDGTVVWEDTSNRSTPTNSVAFGLGSYMNAFGIFFARESFKVEVTINSSSMDPVYVYTVYQDVSIT